MPGVLAGMVGVRTRLWAEISFGAAVMIAAVATAVWPQWIERVFGVDPDARSGAMEWAGVVILSIATLAMAAAARMEWRRVRAVTDRR